MRLKLLMALTLLLGCDPAPRPVPQAIPIGSGPEATGERLVDVVEIEWASTSHSIATVASWLKQHPNYTVETMAPLFSGGRTPRFNSYIIVARKDEK